MNGQKKPERFYTDTIESIDLLLHHYKKKHNTFGFVKLVLIAVAVLGILKVLSSDPQTSVGIFSGAVLVFIVIAMVHEKLLRKIRHQKTLKTINLNELAYLHHRFPSGSNDGAGFKDPDHYYVSDLDIFGAKSVFHYINRAVTAIGRRQLAVWLKHPAQVDEIQKRQDAVMELTQKARLRQAVAAHGLFMDDSTQKLDAIHKLLDEPFMLLDHKLWRFLMITLPILTLGAVGFLFYKFILAVPLSFFVLQFIINGVFFKRFSHIYSATTRCYKILRAYSQIIGEIEKENFVSPMAKDLKRRLSSTTGDQTASLSIRKFSSLLEWFDARLGAFHFLFNNIFMWDFHCVYRLEKWRRHNAHNVPQWFEVIGKFEALSSFGSVHFNNPAWVMPEVVEQSFLLEAEALGHPLIPTAERVCNDMQVTEKRGQGKVRNGNLMVVTGPNMAGKSTFLRTVGVNIVLALAGGPVCAKRFSLSRIKLFSSMQSSDSLDKHLSLFYAELQRLKMILDGLDRNEPVFFLIDEMLKGTNALDRQKGAVAMLKQLIRSRANGISATHDLKLTTLEDPNEWKKTGDEFPKDVHITNYHFDGYVEGDKLLFDYKLKPGVCRSFNALALMRKMGIDL